MPRRFLTALNVVACALIALVSFRYLFRVGPIPPLVAENSLRYPWLVLHVVGSATALLLGPLQLLPSVQRRARLHRVLGRSYVAGCTLGGVSGLALSWGTAAGPIAAAGFGMLAVVWLFTTTAGWLSATQRRLAAHREWMVRSFALTFAAVTLRLYLGVLPLLPIAFLDGYRAIAFLCWVPNLLMAELLLRRDAAVRVPKRPPGRFLPGPTRS